MIFFSALLLELVYFSAQLKCLLFGQSCDDLLSSPSGRTWLGVIESLAKQKAMLEDAMPFRRWCVSCADSAAENAVGATCACLTSHDSVRRALAGLKERSLRGVGVYHRLLTSDQHGGLNIPVL